MKGQARLPDRHSSSWEERLGQALQELADAQLKLDRARVGRLNVEALFEEVLGAMSDALLLVDQRGRIWRVNQAAARLLGQDADELVGRPLSQVAGSDVPSSPWELFDRNPKGQLESLETSFPGRDATAVPVSLSCAVIRDPQGKVLGAVYAARDLSQTHRLLHELEEAESLWRLLAEASELLSAEMDPRRALPSVCRLITEATGCGSALILVQGSIIEDVVLAEAGMAAARTLPSLTGPLRPGTALSRVIMNGAVVHAPTLRPDFPVLDRRDTWQARSAGLVPLAARAQALGALVLFSDQPEGVSAAAVRTAELLAPRIALAVGNARLRDSLAELEAAREAARSRQEMAAGLSHDMKTPLAVITAALAGLRSTGEELAAGNRDQVYAAMARQGDRLSFLIQQFLDYSRLELHHPLPVQIRAVDVGQVVKQVVATWGGDTAIAISVPDDLPPALADPVRLDQVLVNLLSNALKFSPPGFPVRIEARRAGGEVEVRIIDQGPGMTPSDLARVFDKFYRGSAAKGTEGSGLGLYISKAAIEAQGGRLAAHSRLGEGTRFTVSLRVAESG
jgi:PAS domain S-box-containing protein